MEIHCPFCLMTFTYTTASEDKPILPDLRDRIQLLSEQAAILILERNRFVDAPFYLFRPRLKRSVAEIDIKLDPLLAKLQVLRQMCWPLLFPTLTASVLEKF